MLLKEMISFLKGTVEKSHSIRSYSHFHHYSFPFSPSRRHQHLRGHRSNSVGRKSFLFTLFFARTLTPFPRIRSASYLNEKGFLPLRFEARGELGEGEGGGQSEKGARLGPRKGAERDYKIRQGVGC